MGDIFFVRSADPEILSTTSANTLLKLRELASHYSIDQIRGPDWSLITGRNSFTPYEIAHDGQGACAVIGSTYDRKKTNVPELRTPTFDDRKRFIREFSCRLNYGVVISIEGNDLLVAADHLGLYPVYYLQTDKITIVTSVPSLFHCWPDFRAEVEPSGLVSILLFAHTCLGHTIFKDVFRLEQGALLWLDRVGRLRSERVYLKPESPAPRNLDEAVEAYDAVLSSRMDDLAGHDMTSLLLSGGLDSRLLAGYLGRRSGDEVSAVSWGDGRDLETRAAARVASAIGARHECVPFDQKEYPAYAQKAFEFEALTNGLFSLNEWAFTETPRRPVLAGYYGDLIMGMNHAQWGQEATTDLHTFHAICSKSNSYGFTPGVVRELVRGKDIDDTIFHLLREMNKEYYGYPEQSWQRSWWYDLRYRSRFLIGRAPKIIAYNSWPVLPFVDRKLIELATTTPYSLLKDRRIQKEVLIRRFPELAKLPLAGNVAQIFYRIASTQQPSGGSMTQWLQDSISWHWRNAAAKITHAEPCYYLRVFDINGVGWRSLRDKARGLALKTDAWLDSELVLRLIPPSARPVQASSKELVSGTQGLRTLIGLISADRPKNCRDGNPGSS